MYKKLKALSNLNRIMYSTLFNNMTHGLLKKSDNKVYLETDGVFRTLDIRIQGKIFIYNKLTNGYSIRINDSSIFIVNFLGKNLKNNGLIFEFDGDFKITKAEVKTFSGDIIVLDVEDLDILSLLNNSKTNVEDSTILLLEEPPVEPVFDGVRNNEIDDDTIKGLYTSKPFVNGYSGYYNYSPTSKVYTTGKMFTNESKSISNPKHSLKSAKIKHKITKLSSKLAIKEQKTEKETIDIPEEKTKIITPVTKGKKEIKKIGGKY